MPLDIDFLDETEQLDEGQIGQLKSLLVTAYEYENITEPCELSVTFVDNERIQEINREYRDKDMPTDVISFALEEMGEDEIDIIGTDAPRTLGDIIISIPKAKEQAVEYGHSFERELGFLSVHGFLHLLGYDHQTEADEKNMFERQEKILQKFGLSR